MRVGPLATAQGSEADPQFGGVAGFAQQRFEDDRPGHAPGGSGQYLGGHAHEVGEPPGFQVPPRRQPPGHASGAGEIGAGHTQPRQPEQDGHHRQQPPFLRGKPEESDHPPGVPTHILSIFSPFPAGYPRDSDGLFIGYAASLVPAWPGEEGGPGARR